MMATVHYLPGAKRPKEDRKKDKLLSRLSDFAIVNYNTYRARLHKPPTENQIRQLRYIWMRGNLTVEDLPALRWMSLGGLVGRGLLSIPEKGRLRVTAKGMRFIHS